MKKDNASQSAAIIAAHRAIESLKPAGERVCFDPLAEKLIPPRTTVIGEADISKEQALELFKQFVPGFHEYFLARTRYIDDYLAESIEKGLLQLVILGAGYDSRAYRFDALKNVSVFEVDHPATQSVKKESVEKIFNVLPHHVKFVPVDLQSDDLGKRLPESGYDAHLKTLFIIEGVTMYLSPEAVDRMFDFIVKHSGPGSAFLFDFTTADVVEGKETRPEAIAWRQKASDSSEPLRFGISFDRLESFLSERNCSTTGMVSHEYFKTAYFDNSDKSRNATPILAIAHGTKF